MLELVLSAIITIVTIYIIVNNIKGCLKFCCILAALTLAFLAWLIYGPSF